MNIIEAELHILARVRYYWQEYKQNYPALPPEHPKVTCYSKAVRIAGFAYYNLNKGVEFNLAFFCSLDNKADFDEVIAHELAHIIQYRIYPKAKQAHGPEFRTIMQLIGFSGKTYHNFSVAKAKVMAVKLANESMLLDL